MSNLQTQLVALTLLVTSAASAQPTGPWVQQHFQFDERFEQLNDIAFGNGRFVAVGNSGVIYTSEAGAEWTKTVISAANHFRAVQYGNEAFWVLGGDGGLVSTNGLDWQLAPMPGGNNLLCAAGKVLVMGGIEPRPRTQLGVLFRRPGRVGTHSSGRSG